MQYIVLLGMVTVWACFAENSSHYGSTLNSLLAYTGCGLLKRLVQYA